MRRFWLLLVVFAPLLTLGQDTITYYQDWDVGKYKGLKFVIQEDERYNLMYSLFFSLEDAKNKKPAYVESGVLSSRDSLKGKTFSYIKAVDVNNNDLEKVNTFERCYLLFSDNSTGELLYLSYFPKDINESFGFPFAAIVDSETNKLLKKEKEKSILNKYKDAMIYSKDDFTKKISLTTPLLLDIESKKDTYSDVRLLKTKNTMGLVEYYLILDASGGDYTVRPKGCFILFDDGFILKKPEVDVSVKASGSRYYSLGFNYTCAIKMTQTDLALFRKKTIKKFRLHTYDQDVSARHGDLLKMYLSLMIDYKL